MEFFTKYSIKVCSLYLLSYKFKQPIGTPPTGPKASLSGRCLSHTVLKGAIKRQWRIASAISRERSVQNSKRGRQSVASEQDIGRRARPLITQVC
jgi:hypothetical protein